MDCLFVFESFRTSEYDLGATVSGQGYAPMVWPPWFYGMVWDHGYSPRAASLLCYLACSSFLYLLFTSQHIMGIFSEL